ncbi:MAG: MurR/RpiR family transcriptional regulator [Rhodobacteraceae bacterium]|nr:MurR/RpiR family transcriptional regulator [Paracoccaceae bacterium]
MPAPAATAHPSSALGYARPATYEELLAVLSSGAAGLPKRLRQVAVYLTQHPAEVALGSISKVATDVGVQPSTLVRFAQIFGYAGFSDFQDLFKAHLKGGLPGPAPRRAEDRPPRAAPHALSGLCAAAAASVARLDEEFDAPAFARAAELLAGADLIHLIGSKRAFPVTSYMSLTLAQHGVRNVLVSNIGSAAHDQIACLGPADAVLSVSFSPYNSVTPELTAAAADRGATVVAITDSPFSPLIDLSGAALIVVESAAEGYRTLAASLVMGLGLSLAVARLRAAARPPPPRPAAGRGRRAAP